MLSNILICIPANGATTESYELPILVEGESPHEDDDDIIDEDEVLSRSTERRLSSISDEERSKISEAVSAQAKAIQELMNSNKFASISRSNSTVSSY